MKGDELAFGGIEGNAKGFDATRGALTVRQYFAAKAMQGLLANHRFMESSAASCKADVAEHIQTIGRSAILYADALLAAEEQKP